MDTDTKGTLLKDGNGQFSSFRAGWLFTVFVVVLVWAYVSFKTGAIAPWPLDGTVTGAIFIGHGAKTFAERSNK